MSSTLTLIAALGGFALGVIVIAYAALRVVSELRDVRKQLDECTRDRSALRKQLELMLRALFAVIPLDQRRRLSEAIDAAELDEAA